LVYFLSGASTDRSLTGVKVATALSDVLRQRQGPTAINVDNGLSQKSRRQSFARLVVAS